MGTRDWTVSLRPDGRNVAGPRTWLTPSRFFRRTMGTILKSAVEPVATRTEADQLVEIQNRAVGLCI